MPEEVSGITRIAIDRTNREFPRRDPQQQGSKRHPHRPPHPESEPPSAGAEDEAPTVGSRLNVRA